MRQIIRDNPWGITSGMPLQEVNRRLTQAGLIPYSPVSNSSKSFEVHFKPVFDTFRSHGYEYPSWWNQDSGICVSTTFKDGILEDLFWSQSKQEPSSVIKSAIKADLIGPALLGPDGKPIYSHTRNDFLDVMGFCAFIGGLLCVLLVIIASLLKGICYLFGCAWLAWLLWLTIIIVLGIGFVLIYASEILQKLNR